ncbi:dynein regulatory complex subunit 4-like [Lycorma delicatula]|uniref:dynein regulatory complex subunit 4-like n=1 Tax=Lycorma delicatula TaxID=130591 RepID=UPI003F510A50
MPPKGKGDKKQPVLIEGVDTTEMTFPQLQQHSLLVYEKLLKEREERNYFQLERDKLRTFLDLSRTQLDEVRAEIRNKDYALELAEEKRQKDIREINQQVKFLMYEQNLQLNEASIKEKTTLILAGKDHSEQEMELLTDKKELKSKLKTQEENQLNEIRALRLQHGKEMSEMRDYFEKTNEELENKFEKKIFNLRTLLELKNKMEVFEGEERKNLQIKKLIDNHKNDFDNMRNYYNNITLNNFSLITNLKDSIEDLKKKEAVKDKNLEEVLKENKILVEELNKKENEMKNLKHQLANFKKETLGVLSLKREITGLKAELDKQKSVYDELTIKYENVCSEKSKSEAEKMLQAIELQREVGSRLCYLEDKIKALRGQVERRENVITDFRKALVTCQGMGDKGPLMRELQNIINVYDEQRSRRLTYRHSLIM